MSLFYPNTHPNHPNPNTSPNPDPNPKPNPVLNGMSNIFFFLEMLLNTPRQVKREGIKEQFYLRKKIGKIFNRVVHKYGIVSARRKFLEAEKSNTSSDTSGDCACAVGQGIVWSQVTVRPVTPRAPRQASEDSASEREISQGGSRGVYF